MGTWHYRVAGLDLAVEASRHPAWLSRMLGGEVAQGGTPALTLALEGPAERSTDGDAGTVHGWYKAVPWRCQMDRMREDRRVRFWSAVLREYLALHIVLLPLLRRLLAERGVALVGGAAFERDGCATVISGMTGQGKTALLLGALHRGAHFLGDEYLGVREDGGVVPVVRALALRRSSFGAAPEAMEPLGAGRRFTLRIARLASMLTRGRVEPLVHVTPGDLRLGEADTTPAATSRFVWLEAGQGAPCCEPMSVEELVSELSAFQRRHDQAYGDPTLDIADAGADRWRAAAVRAVERAPRFRLKYGPEALGAALDRLLDGK